MKKIKNFIYIIAFIIVIAATFISSYNNLIDDFESTAKVKQFDLNNELTHSDNFIETLTVYGNDYFLHSTVENDLSLHNLLKYDPDLDMYNLDAIEGTEKEKSTGNLTGIGKIPDDGIKKTDLNLGLNYNIFFSKFYDRFPDIAWMYYISENNFISQYPWVSSKDFKFKQDIKNMDFYSSVTPKNNPLKKAVWSPVYLDAAGKGLMVTLSSPIYYNNTFMGAVCLDITNKRLSDILKCDYDGYLIDGSNSILATSNDIEFNTEVLNLNNLVRDSKNYMKKIDNLEDGKVKRIDDYYIYKTSFKDAPWTMIMRIPVSLIILKSLLYTFPVIFIVFILLHTFDQMEKRKTIEDNVRNISITDSLTGLKNRSYLDEIIGPLMTNTSKLSLIIFDLDRFKRVNDTWGHPVGDDVLKQVAEIAKNSIRDEDVIIRLGGEEFLILLKETSLTDTYEIAERVRKALEIFKHPIVGKQTVSLGISEKIGNEPFNNLYSRADKALYIAKEGGRNRTVIYQDEETLAIACSKIKWSREFESGDELLDKQHQEIFEMCISLLYMANSNVKLKDAKEQLNIFLEKMLNHFEYEQNIQMKIGYPACEEHAKLHQIIISKALKFQESFHKAELNSTELLNFLLDDIIFGHVINEDKKFFPYIKN